MISDGAKQIKTIKYFIEGSDRPEYGYKIKHEGSSWLVPSWIPATEDDDSRLRPIRIIRLGGRLPFGPSSQHQNVDLILELPLDKDIVHGRKPSRYPLVIEAPEIFVRESDLPSSD